MVGINTYPRIRREGKILVGPGPSNIHPRVLQALSSQITGHLDKEFMDIMNAIKILLAETFMTSNELVIPIAGTGSTGMEASLVSLIEPGNKVLICVNGVFGQRMADMVKIYGGDLHVIEGEWGRIIEPDEIKKTLAKHPADIIGIVHVETSTGVEQPIEPIAKIAKEYGAFLIVDAVTSLAGTKIPVDDWGIDVVFSGTQKCLSCPPGLAPITVNRRVENRLISRESQVKSWYLDLTMFLKYRDRGRFYHHTAPISMIYALYEALLIIHEEGLDAVFRRHLKHGNALKAGITAMGLKLFAQNGYQASMLTSVEIPEGIDGEKIRNYLLINYGLEIGGGLGPMKGRIWRIGLMGYSCTRENVMLILSGLEEALIAQGFKVPQGAGVFAAREAYKPV